MIKEVKQVNSTEKNLLLQMQKVTKAIIKAKDMSWKSVKYLREEVLDDAVIALKDDPNVSLTLFGVKNTNQIDIDIILKLQEVKGFLFHTIDKAAEGGRAIDVDMMNPLTGRVMTGSSSGSCVNILRGINDFAIATDGGGSVIAPALSTGLYSIMAKGLGLKGKDNRVSSDDLSFVPGIGVISHDYSICKKAIAKIAKLDDTLNKETYQQEVCIAIPKEQQVILPNGIDMRQLLNRAIIGLDGIVKFVEVDLKRLQDRREAISICKKIFHRGIDIIMTAEGPVDLYGMGDSVMGTWGETGRSIQQESGKYLMKVANMLDATTAALPTEELGTGILLIGHEGIHTGKAVIELGDIISKLYQRPPLFERYFIDGCQQRRSDGFII